MARISEIHYKDNIATETGIGEYVEIALSPAEFTARGDYSIAFYDHHGNVGLTVPLDDANVEVVFDANANEYVLLIREETFPTAQMSNLDTPHPLSNGDQFEAVALVDTSSSTVIDFYDIGTGTQNIEAQDGPAVGQTSENVPVATGQSLQWRQPDPDTVELDHDLTPGGSGIICLTAGTLIDTPGGPRPIEALRPGDRVLTLDRGAQPLRLNLARRVGTVELATAPKLVPVRIDAGALGPGLPARPLLVSRQHRMLIASSVVAAEHGADGVLVPAIAMVGHPGIELATDLREVTYHHLVFDRHEVIRAEGAATESLHVHGPQTLKLVSPRARAELLALFPRLGTTGYPAALAAPARRIVQGPPARRLIAAHRRGRSALAALTVF